MPATAAKSAASTAEASLVALKLSEDSNTSTSAALAAGAKAGVDAAAALADFVTATTEKKAEDRLAGAQALAAKVQSMPRVLDAINFSTIAEEQLRTTGKALAPARHGTNLCVHEIVKAIGQQSESVTAPLILAILETLDDKDKKTRDAAMENLNAIFAGINPNAVGAFVPELLKVTPQWKGNEKRLRVVADLPEKATAQMTRSLPGAIPSCAFHIHDLKDTVQEGAKAALIALCSCCKNPDVLPLIPVLIEALESADDVADCVHKLASTTFVQTIDATTLSIMNPILIKGFKGRDNAVKRACARIAENMAKLVEDSRDLAPFMPTLYPLMENAAKNVSTPEVRDVINAACKILKKKADLKAAVVMVTMEEVQPIVTKIVAGVVKNAPAHVVDHIAQLLCTLNDWDPKAAEHLTELLTPYLMYFATKGEAAKICAKIVEDCSREVPPEAEEVEVNAEELCNCEFSLAYGNKVLLRKTQLRLHRGFRYGLIGKNDSGKTSLMKAISEHRVEGFPPESELRTIFVQTDIQGELSDLTVLEYVLADKIIQESGVTKEKLTETLNAVGFNDDSPANTTSPVGSLSGGWKMKLALARAMLLNGDILLFDEPTNHLDTYNKEWVENYLLNIPNVTCVMVSHDSGFLDRVVTHMMQIDDLKLSVYSGNLSKFVERFPEHQAFFELKSTRVKFTFPQPGRLPGVNSKGKAIMKMDNITFTYPGAPKAQLNNVTIQLSLGSRVACVGVNGAGKSTMIKLLTGELEPDEGSGKVWSHPNCRVGYIAQHAFHHIEHRLHETANEYIRGRFANGNDREAQDKVTNLVSEEELKTMQSAMTVEQTDPENGLTIKFQMKVERLTEGRRELRKEKDQEYECVVAGRTTNVWIRRKTLVKGGWEKVLNRTDDRIAMRATMFQRPLTQGNVQKHLNDVGLEPEFSTHIRMEALSGGQKVKVVLAAALWNCPHILILDEPTNYLDRESLGALAAAIRVYEGGVVMITHHSQFCDDLCPTVWHLENNTLNVKGDAEWMAEMVKMGLGEAIKMDKDEMLDKFGNTVVLTEDKTKMTNKEKKARKKKRDAENRKRKKKGLEPLDSEDDEW